MDTNSERSGRLHVEGGLFVQQPEGLRFSRSSCSPPCGTTTATWT